MPCERKIGPFDCCSVVCGDCLELMKALPDKCVDLVLTDPPFNAGMKYDSFEDKSSWPEYADKMAGMISESERLSKGLILVFFSVNGMLELAAKKRPRHVCVWDKPMSFSPRQGGSAFLPHWEPCLIYGKTWGEMERVPNYCLPDVWHFNPAERNGHPCPKPEDLMLFLVSSVPSDTVLDPFCGSGTALVAAKKLARHFLGFDLSANYCRIARERIALVEAQPSLFAPKPEQLKLATS